MSNFKTVAEIRNNAQGTAFYFGNKVVIIEVLPTTYGKVNALVAIGNEVSLIDFSDLVMITWMVA